MDVYLGLSNVSFWKDSYFILTYSMIPVIINWNDNRLYLNFKNSIDCSTFNFYYCSTFWNTTHFLDLTVSQDLNYLAFRESQLIRILSRVIANSNHFSTSRGGTSRRCTNTICMAIALKIFKLKRHLESFTVLL